MAGITKAAPRPITRAEGDELAGRAGHGGEGGADAEDDEAAEQHLLAAEPVAEEARGEQQPGEDERVGVDRPLQLALGGAEAGGRGGGDRLDRDVQDRVVEHHDQQAQHQHAEDRPAAPVHRLGYAGHGGGAAGGVVMPTSLDAISIRDRLVSENLYRAYCRNGLTTGAAHFAHGARRRGATMEAVRGRRQGASR